MLDDPCPSPTTAFGRPRPAGALDDTARGVGQGRAPARLVRPRAVALIRLAELHLRSVAAAAGGSSASAPARTLLDAAERALAADLARCVARPRRHGAVRRGLADAAVPRHRQCRHRRWSSPSSSSTDRTSPLASHRDRAEPRPTDAVIQSGLFNGRAGLVLLLAGDLTMHATPSVAPVSPGTPCRTPGTSPSPATSSAGCRWISAPAPPACCSPSRR